MAGAQDTGGAGSDSLASLENLTGGSANDILRGDSGQNTLRGGAGNDRIHARDLVQDQVLCEEGSTDLALVDELDITAGCEGIDDGSAPVAAATRLRISLVPAYLKCTAPNRTHGPPLASPSCSPPAQLSHYATAGTPDANGQPAKLVGSVRMDRVVGDPLTLADEADIALAASVTDIRNKADVSDYTSELQVTATVRITDSDNGGPSGTDTGTVSDLSFSFTVPCAASGETTVGSTCAATTTADALVPNTIREGKRAIWQLGQVQVTDGGEDGLASTTTDNMLFLKQGIFVP